jgi:hypothetical protein
MLRQARHEGFPGTRAESAPTAAAHRALSRLRERVGVRARTTGGTLTLPSLTRRAPPSPAGAGEGSKDEADSIPALGRIRRTQ